MPTQPTIQETHNQTLVGVVYDISLQHTLAGLKESHNFFNILKKLDGALSWNGRPGRIQGGTRHK